MVSTGGWGKKRALKQAEKKEKQPKTAKRGLEFVFVEVMFSCLGFVSSGHDLLGEKDLLREKTERIGYLDVRDGS